MGVFTNTDGVTTGQMQLGVDGPMLMNDAGVVKVFAADGTTPASIAVDQISGDVRQKAGTAIQTANGQGVKLNDADGSNSVTIKAPATVPADVTITMPSTAGASGQVLKTDGTGNLSWADVMSGSPFWLEPVRLATVSGFTVTYSNGASGVGATLTSVSNVALTIDGFAAAVGDRVLIKNQTATAQNGVYVVTATGSVGAQFVLTRAADMDTGTEFAARAVLVRQGSGNQDRGYICTNDTDVVVGTTAVNFAHFAGASVPFSLLDPALVVNSTETVAANSSSDLTLPTTKAVADFVNAGVLGAVKLYSFQVELSATNTIPASGSISLVTTAVMVNPSLVGQIVADTYLVFDQSVNLQVGVAQADGSPSLAGGPDAIKFLGSYAVQSQTKKVVNAFVGCDVARKLQILLVNQTATPMVSGKILVYVYVSTFAETKKSLPA